MIFCVSLYVGHDKKAAIERRVRIKIGHEEREREREREKMGRFG
jgi:hypothetical protein